jgi:UDP-N-acetyl-D-mannosaminuronic acid transferase (WecB/TagA/CpsF family)
LIPLRPLRNGNQANGAATARPPRAWIASIEYVEGKSVSSDAGLLVRAAALHVLVPPAEGKAAARLRILGHRIDNLTMKETLDRVAAWVEAPVPRRIAFLNADCVNQAVTRPAYRAAIRESGASVLLVALGAPKQDEWNHRHLAESGAQVAIGVGGLFDFYARRVARAPGWMRELGLEWIYRFLQEPGRMWKRYWVGNAVFLARVLRERWRGPAKANRSKEQIA